MTDAVDRLSLLVEARARLRAAMVEQVDCPHCGGVVDASAGNLPGVVRELRATLVEIDAIAGAAGRQASVTERLRDDLAAKRAERSAS